MRDVGGDHACQFDGIPGVSRNTVGPQLKTDLFHTRRDQNLFDRMAIDVGRLYEQFPIDEKVNTRPNRVAFASGRLYRLYRSRLIPERYRVRAWQATRQLHLDLSWYQEFRSYWTNVLGGRPLWGVEDFYFLVNTYRTRFQDNQLPHTDDSRVHLQAWQQPELLYQLFHLVRQEKLINHVTELHLTRDLMGGWPKSMLEFGCGTAPIVTSLFGFFKPGPGLEVYISDIQTIAFHYAAWKFRECSNVTPLLLVPDNDFQLKMGPKVDVIYCMTVLEHLGRPLDTVRTLHDTLGDGGLLFLDYIKEEGGHAHGLDAQQAINERDLVLDFVESNFETVYGRITRDGSIGLTVVRKT